MEFQVARNSCALGVDISGGSGAGIIITIPANEGKALYFQSCGNVRCRNGVAIVIGHGDGGRSVLGIEGNGVLGLCLPDCIDRGVAVHGHGGHCGAGRGRSVPAHKGVAHTDGNLLGESVDRALGDVGNCTRHAGDGVRGVGVIGQSIGGSRRAGGRGSPVRVGYTAAGFVEANQRRNARCSCVVGTLCIHTITIAGTEVTAELVAGRCSGTAGSMQLKGALTGICHGSINRRGAGSHTDGAGAGAGAKHQILTCALVYQCESCSGRTAQRPDMGRITVGDHAAAGSHQGIFLPTAGQSTVDRGNIIIRACSAD